MSNGCGDFITDFPATTRKVYDMKTKLLATAAVAVLATALYSPWALADGPRPSGSTAISQAAGTGLPSGEAATPHYQWQYHYVGRHPQWEGYWALVK